MPEFIMPVGDSPATFQELGSFAQGYIEAMFFTSTGSADDEELEHATFADLAPETLISIENDCEAFQTDAGATLDKCCAREGYSLEQAGRDFWLTRNHHGAGDILTSLAHQFGETDLYRGDDGRLYLS